MNARLLGATALVLVLGGCASFTPDAGLGPTTVITRAELNKDVVKVSDEAVATMTQDRAEELLRRPLTPDSAVQIALLKNRGLQAAFNDLGVAEADYVKATLPPARLASRITPRRELRTGDRTPDPDWAVRACNAARACRRRGAALPGGPVPHGRGGAAARGRNPAAVLPDGRGQPAGCVYAAGARYRRSPPPSSQSSSVRAGALNKLEQAREHAFYPSSGPSSPVRASSRRSSASGSSASSGLWGGDIDFRLPGTLPPLPGRRLVPRTSSGRRLQRRVDLQALRYDLHGVARQYGLTKRPGSSPTSSSLGSASTSARRRSFAGVDGEVEIEREKVKRRGLEVEFDDPDLRLRPGEPPQRAGDLYGGGKPPRRAGRERPLGSTRGLPALPRQLRPRAVTTRAASCPLQKTIQDEALLQYSGMLVDVTRADHRRARPHPLEHRRHQRPPRLLDRRDRPQGRPRRRRDRRWSRGRRRPTCGKRRRSGRALAKLMNALGLDLTTMGSPISNRPTKRNP